MLLLLGLFSAAIHSFFPSVSDKTLVPLAYGLRPLLVSLQPLRSLVISGKVEEEDGANQLSSLLFQAEADFINPKDPDLLSRRVIFANLLERHPKEALLTLDVGRKHGVKAGMAAVVGDLFAGMVTEVEEESSHLQLAIHQESRVSVSADGVQMVAAGTGSGIRVLLPSRFDLPAGQIAKVDELPSSAVEASSGNWKFRNPAVGALLGKIIRPQGSSRGHARIDWFLNPQQIQGLWLLGEPTGGSAPTASPIERWRRQELQLVWPGIAPGSDSLVMMHAASAELPEGAAVVRGESILGRIERSAGGVVWVRLLTDPGFKIDQIWLGKDGRVLSLGPRMLSAQPASLGEGWLFTGAGQKGIPKGLLIGEIRQQEGRQLIILERNFYAPPVQALLQDNP